MLRHIFLIAVAFIIFALNLKPANAADFALDRILMKYKANVSESQKNTVRSSHKLKIAKKIDKLNVEVVEVLDKNVEESLNKLKKSAFVEYAEPDYIGHAADVPQDPQYPLQWGLQKINSSSAWDLTHGSSNILIAVVDSGIDSTHPDLSGKVVNQANFTDEPSTADVLGHGTLVAGIAAASTNNNVGIAGGGYDTKLISAKVISGSNFAYASWVSSGIVWSVDNGAKVINLSLGFTNNSQPLEDAINYAWSRGAVISVAAMNNGNSTPMYPAYFTNSIAVGSTDQNDNKTSFSNYGSWVDVAAPGIDIYTTGKGGVYGYAYGTSMSAPFVSGLAALIYAKEPTLTNTQVRNQIEQHTDTVPGTGTHWTYGRINSYKALNTIVGPTPTPSPTPTPTATPTPTPTPTATPSPTPNQVPVGDGLYGLYYDNTNFTNFKLYRIDQTVGFNWGSASPAPGVGADTFSVLWAGFFMPAVSGNYIFSTYSDDGVRLWLNDALLINNWTNHSLTANYSSSVNLTAGVKYPLYLEYYDNIGGAIIVLGYQGPDIPEQVIPKDRLFSQ